MWTLSDREHHGGKSAKEQNYSSCDGQEAEVKRRGAKGSNTSFWGMTSGIYFLQLGFASILPYFKNIILRTHIKIHLLIGLQCSRSPYFSKVHCWQPSSMYEPMVNIPHLKHDS